MTGLLELSAKEVAAVVLLVVHVVAELLLLHTRLWKLRDTGGTDLKT